MSIATVWGLVKLASAILPLLSAIMSALNAFSDKQHEVENKPNYNGPARKKPGNSYF